MITPIDTPAPAPIRTSVPRTPVLHAINPFVSAILRSPLHRLLSPLVLLLTYTGRKTGRSYTIPVGYSREDDTFTIWSAHPWWKNLSGGAPVVVRLRGRQRTGWAVAIEDREAVLTEVERLVARCGLKEAGRRIGLALDTTPPPAPDDIAQAMQGRVMIRLTLDGGSERGGA